MSKKKRIRVQSENGITIFIDPKNISGYEMTFGMERCTIKLKSGSAIPVDKRAYILRLDENEKPTIYENKR